jgi:phosphoribosylformylglycinamidine synthase
MAVKGIADFANVLSLPCVGGKVSFYNQDEASGKAIKSSPVIAALGLIEKPEHVTKIAFRDGGTVIAVGKTKRELGGSEYSRLMSVNDGSPPELDFHLEKRTLDGVLDCVRDGYVTACHDCSKGGLAVALAEMAISGSIGASLDLRPVTTGQMRDEELLFSESNSRFVITTNKPDHVLRRLSERDIPVSAVGNIGGNSLKLTLPNHEFQCDLAEMQDVYEHSLERILEPWQK